MSKNQIRAPYAQLDVRPSPGRQPGLTARLALPLTLIILVLLGTYMVVSHRQRLALLEAEIKRHAELLGAILQRNADDLLEQGRFDDLDRVLRLALQSDEVYAAYVAADSRLIAGDAVDPSCLAAQLPRPLPARRQTGHSACGKGVQWSALPVGDGSLTLIVGIEQILVREAVTAALSRQILLALLLAGATAVAIAIVLQRSLSQPLGTLVAAVGDLGDGGGTPPPLPAATTREVTQLAAALHRARLELDARDHELQAHADEQVALQRRLAQTERFAMMGRLSGGLAHELGSPLTVVGLRAQRIGERATQSPALQAEAHAISREVERMTAFIQGLLHLSRTQGVVTVPVDMRAVAEAVVDEMEARLADTGVQLALSVPDHAMLVAGDETMLRHALQNVMRNAVHALQDHHGERRITVSVTARDARVVVQVEDTGPGIPAEQLPLVFEAFYTTRNAQQGVGLGLAVTKGIVEEHGGRAHIENRAEGGLRVVFVLPRGSTAPGALIGDGTHG
jgi:two-component system, NtrC family, sensor kinase